MSITLLSHKTNNLVIGETDHVRERANNETIHYSDDNLTRCLNCGALIGPLSPWTDSETIFKRHPTRCEAL